MVKSMNDELTEIYEENHKESLYLHSRAILDLLTPEQYNSLEDNKRVNRYITEPI